MALIRENAVSRCYFSSVVACVDTLAIRVLECAQQGTMKDIMMQRELFDALDDTYGELLRHGRVNFLDEPLDDKLVTTEVVATLVAKHFTQRASQEVAQRHEEAVLLLDVGSDIADLGDRIFVAVTLLDVYELDVLSSFFEVMTESTILQYGALDRESFITYVTMMEKALGDPVLPTDKIPEEIKTAFTNSLLRNGVARTILAFLKSKA